jgi:hypothetical protein
MSKSEYSQLLATRKNRVKASPTRKNRSRAGPKGNDRAPASTIANARGSRRTSVKEQTDVTPRLDVAKSLRDWDEFGKRC